MSVIAVDVVLLPEEAAGEKVIEANGRLVEKFGSEIVLHKENCLPHISLAMGCIDEDDLTQVGEVLEEIWAQRQVKTVRAVGVKSSGNAVGQAVSAVEIEKDSQIQGLHEMVMERMERFFKYQPVEDMICGDEKAAESTLMWIRDYREKSSFENFRPHITIGYGMPEDFEFAGRFGIFRLAVCHLGNHCTCRKVLRSV